MDGMAMPTAVSARRGLPPLSVYLQSVVALGLGTLKSALPAILLLYFYRLGMGLYLAFTLDEASPLGLPDPRAQVASYMAMAATYLPVLVLIYTPFLPLQDALLRGRRVTFGASVRHVLERVWAFAVSAVAQSVIVLGPPVLLIAGLVTLVRSLPPRPDELVRLLTLAAMMPCLVWMAISVLFLLFATPAVVLDDRGPLRSIALSMRRVGGQLGGILGRLLAVGIVALFAAVAASLPDALLQAASSAAGLDHPGLRVARAVWESAVAALLFPFTVAALMVLYRAVVPAEGAAATALSPGQAAHPPEPQPAPTPFRFE
jgi:hypothetical protein